MLQQTHKSLVVIWHIFHRNCPLPLLGICHKMTILVTFYGNFKYEKRRSLDGWRSESLFVSTPWERHWNGNDTLIGNAAAALYLREILLIPTTLGERWLPTSSEPMHANDVYIHWNFIFCWLAMHSWTWRFPQKDNDHLTSSFSRRTFMNRVTLPPAADGNLMLSAH